MSERELVRRPVGMIEMGDAEFERMKGIASAFAQSDAFKDIDAPKAFAKMVLGHELGLGIAQSMQGIHLVKGNVQMHYSTMLTCVKAHGWKYKILEHTAEKCVMQWTDPDGEIAGTSEFTIEEAKKAGLVKADGNWEKWPKAMLLARAVSSGVRAYCPEALGGMPVYVDEEVPVGDEYVDGSVEPVVDAEEVSLTAVVELLPPDLHDRFYAVWGEACRLLPGRYTLPGVRMSLAAQDPEVIHHYLRTMEEAVAAAREREDAEQSVEPPEAEVVEVDEARVRVLERQLSDLVDRRTDIEENPGNYGETDEALREIDEEMVRVGAQLAEAQGAQGTLL